MSTAAKHTIQAMDGQSSSPVRAAVDVIAITIRDDFLLELGHAVGGQAAVNPVESAAQALELLGHSKRLQVVVIDSRDLTEVRATIDAVEAQAPQLAVLVFAEAHAEQEIAATLKGSKVFAVLPIPVDPRKTAAVFEGAVADSKAQKTEPRSTEARARIIPEVSPPIAHEPIRPVPRDETGNNTINLRVAGGIVLAVLVMTGLWFLTRDKTDSVTATRKPVPENTTTPALKTPAVEAPPSVETSLVTGKVDELLEMARTAMRERRYTEPAGNNALLYYRSASHADPANGEALDGLARVASVLAARVEEAMAASNYEQAALALAQFKSAAPNDERGAVFQSNLAKVRAEHARVQEEAKKKRLAEEQAARETAAAEQKKAREARAALAEAERKAQLTREKEAEERAKAEQAAKAASAAPKSESSASKRRPVSSLQGKLKNKRYVAPEYPQGALAKRLGGVVTMAFTVNAQGETTDIRVETAEPAGVFDKAAIAAVKRWRYEPMLVDGVPTEVPVRMAIRFAPP